MDIKVILHALDFSNVLPEARKENRFVAIDYDNDGSDIDSIIVSEFPQKQEQEEEKVEERKPKENVMVMDKAVENASKTNPISVPKEKKEIQCVNIDGVLYNQELTSLISVPKDLKSFTIPETVTHIGKRVFEGSALQSIIIPNSVTSIGGGAFSDCKNLVSISLPDSLTLIAKRTFSGCTALAAISIPECVTQIGKFAFSHCSKLESLHIPVTVERIGDKAFEYCTALASLIIENDSTQFPKYTFLGCKDNIIHKDADIEWKDVELRDYTICIPDQLGGIIELSDRSIMTSMNIVLSHISSVLPKLHVQYRPGAEPVIVNKNVIYDAVTILNVKDNLSEYLAKGHKSSSVLATLDRMPVENTRMFIPHDMTPYMDFLFGNHAIYNYPIIPIEEVIGDSIEKGALFTIMINGQPNIVWENYKDSRATFVFKCTQENYADKRQRVFDFVMANEKGKRALLHTDKSKEIFGMKPRIVVHNDLASWSARLMSSHED